MREALQAYDRLLLHGGLGLHGRLFALRAAEQHTKLEIDISSRKVGAQGAVQSAECRERTADFSVAEGLALPTDFLPCFLASALAALVRAFAISAVFWVLSFSGRRRAVVSPEASVDVVSPSFSRIFSSGCRRNLLDSNRTMT